MALDEHDDFFLDEYDDNDTPRPSGRTIDFEQPKPGPEIRHDDNRPLSPRPRRRHHKFLVRFILFLVLVGAGTIYFGFFSPYVSQARISGYVTSVEKRGVLFKTFEGEMIVEVPVVGTSELQKQQFVFSIPDEELAYKLQNLEDTGQKVTIIYKKYYGSLPWRGATPNIAVKLLP